MSRFGPAPLGLDKLFWAKITFENDCWRWTGAVDGDGYGKAWAFTPRRHVRAHRLSWEIHRGPVPKGLCVLHHCDRPECVRPDHLFLGTQADNIADKVSKCRQSTGEQSGRSKLSREDVREIRAAYSAGGVTMARLGRRYAVGATNICHIVNRLTWRSA